jgi:AcrR family transcriptional regulator
MPRTHAHPGDGLVARAVARRTPGRPQHAQEVGRLVEATYRVIARTGSLDPTVRDILAEAGLSTQTFYRCFDSKDELLVALLDDGRRRLAGYLEHRMTAAASPAGKVREWIAGVLAQATDPTAAERTRPFLANLDRLAERYPDEQRSSARMIIDLLARALPAVPGHEARLDARLTYLVAIGAMHEHIRERTRPSKKEIDRLTSYCLAGCGLCV